MSAVNVQHLTKQELNVAAALAIGAECVRLDESGRVECRLDGWGHHNFDPTGNWSHTGLLIDAYKVQLEPNAAGHWIAKTDCTLGPGYYAHCYASTSNVAVVRAVVTSLIGRSFVLPTDLSKPQRRMPGLVAAFPNCPVKEV